MAHESLLKPVRRTTCLLLGLSGALYSSSSRAASVEDGARVEFFEKHVRPLLVGNCYNCHSADANAKGGLHVDDRNGLLASGGRGRAVVPGDPANSLLLKAVSYADPDLQMPPKKQLSAEQVAILTKWVQDGAAWPQAAVTIPVQAGEVDPKFEKLKKGHWA